MTLYEVLALIISGASVIIAFIALKRGNTNRYVINQNKKSIGFIEEYLNSSNVISDSTIGGGWAGGTNINCKASNNSVNIQQQNFQMFKEGKLKEQQVVD